MTFKGSDDQPNLGSYDPNIEQTSFNSFPIAGCFSPEEVKSLVPLSQFPGYKIGIVTQSLQQDQLTF